MYLMLFHSTLKSGPGGKWSKSILPQFKKEKGGCRESVVVKSTGVLPEDLSSIPSSHTAVVTVTPVLEDLTPSSGLQQPSVCIHGTQTNT